MKQVTPSERNTMNRTEQIYTELKLTDRLTPGRTPWQTLRARAEEIALSEMVDADPSDEGTTVYAIPTVTADKLLSMAGLEKDTSGRYGGRYWEKDEALLVALIAIADTDSSNR